MTHKIYTIGYSGRTPQQIQAIAEQLDAVIFDIRFSPRSRVPHWCGGNLKKLLGDRYAHVREFGNANYKIDDAPIQLVNYKAGRALIETSPKPVILMCACKDYQTCHRSFIAAQLQADGFETEEITLSVNPKPAPIKKVSTIFQLTLF